MPADLHRSLPMLPINRVAKTWSTHVCFQGLRLTKDLDISTSFLIQIDSIHIALLFVLSACVFIMSKIRLFIFFLATAILLEDITIASGLDRESSFYVGLEANDGSVRSVSTQTLTAKYPDAKGHSVVKDGREVTLFIGEDGRTNKSELLRSLTGNRGAFETDPNQWMVYSDVGKVLRSSAEDVKFTYVDSPVFYGNNWEESVETLLSTSTLREVAARCGGAVHRVVLAVPSASIVTSRTDFKLQTFSIIQRVVEMMNERKSLDALVIVVTDAHISKVEERKASNEELDDEFAFLWDEEPEAPSASDLKRLILPTVPLMAQVPLITLGRNNLDAARDMFAVRPSPPLRAIDLSIEVPSRSVLPHDEEADTFEVKTNRWAMTQELSFPRRTATAGLLMFAFLWVVSSGSWTRAASRTANAPSPLASEVSSSPKNAASIFCCSTTIVLLVYCALL